MKKKVVYKKLALNKATVAHLNRKGMSGIYGGETESACPYGTCTNCESICLEKCPTTDPGTTGATCLLTSCAACG